MYLLPFDNLILYLISRWIVAKGPNIIYGHGSVFCWKLSFQAAYSVKRLKRREILRPRQKLDLWKPLAITYNSSEWKCCKISGESFLLMSALPARFAELNIFVHLLFKLALVYTTKWSIMQIQKKNVTVCLNFLQVHHLTANIINKFWAWHWGFCVSLKGILCLYNKHSEKYVS